MDEQPTHIDLFSGIGGFALAAQWAGFRTIAFCEIDEYCQRVIAKNFDAVLSPSSATRLPSPSVLEVFTRPIDETLAPIHTNIFDFDGTVYRGCNLITGGFPCQPFSIAGKRRGKEDDRHLWPEMLRVIAEARPAWVLGENVPGIIPMELDNVLSQLEAIGYACWPFTIPACAVDARHRRNRLWIVANANESRPQGRNGTELRECASERFAWPGDSSMSLADAAIRSEQPGGTQCDERRFQDEVLRSGGDYACNWEPEPTICRVAHGIPSRAHRLRGLGNAIVPQVAFEILREIRNLI